MPQGVSKKRKRRKYSPYQYIYIVVLYGTWVQNKYSVPEPDPPDLTRSPQGTCPRPVFFPRRFLSSAQFFFLPQTQLVIDRGTIRFSISRDSTVAASVASSTRLLRSRRRRPRVRSAAAAVDSRSESCDPIHLTCGNSSIGSRSHSILSRRFLFGIHA